MSGRAFSLLYAGRVWYRNWVVFRRLLPVEGTPIFFEPLIVLGAIGLGLGVYVTLSDEGSYLEFIAPGIVGSYSLFAAFFETTYGSFLRMEVRRLYHAMIATPLSIEDVITGELLWGATRSVISTVVIMAVLAALGLVSSPLALLGVPLAFVAGLLFAAIGMLFTSVAPSMNTFNYSITLLITPMFYLSGVFFPIDRYPEALRLAAWTLPLTPYVHILRELTTGRVTIVSLWALLYILGLLAVLYLAAVRLMRRRLIR